MTFLSIFGCDHDRDQSQHSTLKGRSREKTTLHMSHRTAVREAYHQFHIDMGMHVDILSRQTLAADGKQPRKIRFEKRNERSRHRKGTTTTNKTTQIEKKLNVQAGYERGKQNLLEKTKITSGPDTTSPPAALALSTMPARSGSLRPMPTNPSPRL